MASVEDLIDLRAERLALLRRLEGIDEGSSAKQQQIIRQLKLTTRRIQKILGITEQYKGNPDW